jgi:hypothetical protein
MKECPICFEENEEFCDFLCNHQVCLSCYPAIIDLKKCPLCRESHTSLYLIKTHVSNILSDNIEVVSESTRYLSSLLSVDSIHKQQTCNLLRAFNTIQTISYLLRNTCEHDLTSYLLLIIANMCTSDNDKNYKKNVSSCIDTGIIHSLEILLTENEVRRYAIAALQNISSTSNISLHRLTMKRLSSFCEIEDDFYLQKYSRGVLYNINSI